jgi:putative MATE family efflux protein
VIPSARLKRIASLAVPIILGMVSQNVLNLVDTAMVGVLGDSALAAVGLGGMLNFSATAFILALGTGVQAMSARRVGEGRVDEAALPLNGGLALGVATALPWSALLFFLVPVFYPYLIDDASVVREGVPYLQARLVAMVAMAVNFSFRGYWNATDRPWLYMRTLIVMHVVNIALNWVLIYGNLGAPALGATGAGIASAIAVFVGSGTYFLLGWRHARPEGFLASLPSSDTLRAISRLSVPTGIQQVFFALGLTSFHLIVGLIGTSELAASSVIINVLLVGLLPGLGFGLAGMSLVGHALGRRDVADARRWGWDVSLVAFVVVACIAVPAVLEPALPLSLFLHDPDTLELARPALRLVAATLAFDAVGAVLMNCLLGAGDSKRIMLISVGFQWLVFLPVAFVLVYWLDAGLTAVWMANVGYRLLQFVTLAVLWKRDGWTSIKV